jgi:hypothetical protein
MGEVDDAGDAEDQRQAGRHQEQRRSAGQAVEQLDQKAEKPMPKPLDVSPRRLPAGGRRRRRRRVEHPTSVGRTQLLDFFGAGQQLGAVQ